MAGKPLTPHAAEAGKRSCPAYILVKAGQFPQSRRTLDSVLPKLILCHFAKLCILMAPEESLTQGRLLSQVRKKSQIICFIDFSRNHKPNIKETFITKDKQH